MHMQIKNTLRNAAFIAVAASFFSLPASAAERLYSDQPPVTPGLAVPGIYSTGVTTLDMTNPNQLSAADFTTREERVLTVEVWYPTDQTEGPKAIYSDVTRSQKPFDLQGTAYRDAMPLTADGNFPLVVLSHGYVGYRTSFFNLAEHLASHGYVVASIDHTDSTTKEVDNINNPFSGFMSTLINRSRDQQFVLDTLAALESDLGSIIDGENAAVAGYSMGGYGSVNTVGGCYGYSEQTLQAFGIPAEFAAGLVPLFNSCHAGREQTDPRWKAMIAFAPWGGESGVHSLESFDDIQVPSLYVAGEFDDISGYENGIKRLFEATGSDDKYMLVYENARHNIVLHPAPSVAYETELDLGFYYEPAWNTETINRINNHMVLAFLGCHVKNELAFCDYLPERELSAQTKLDNGSVSEPWPGFMPRWGTGLQFYRN
jgi:predicted dienelactone hydrolase